MSIDPIIAGQQRPAPATRSGAPDASAPAVPFEDILAGSAAGAPPVSAATAAEILRLKMMDSAMSLGDDSSSSRRNSPMQGLLERFLEQLPKGQGGIGASGSEVGAADGETADTAAATASGATAAEVTGGGAASTDAIIAKASQRYGVDAGLIKAVIKAESNFNPRAVSSAGAQGLMQLMPSTARGLGVTDSFDPEQNVMAGTRFLKDMLRRYGNVDDALAAYNWGPGNVDRHGSDRLPRETRAYLSKVKDYYAQFVG